MAPINGPDLILEVIRARSNAASSDVSTRPDVRASVGKQAVPAPEAGFDAAVRNAAAGTMAQRQATPSDATPSAFAGVPPRTAAQPPRTPESMLQGLLLKSVVEAMLPKEGGSFFGDGTAGSVWRSMLAQHVADELNQSLDLRLIPQAAGGGGKPLGGNDGASLRGGAPVVVSADKPPERRFEGQ